MILGDITCPECGSKDTYEDEDRGEIYCSDCGLTIEENIMVDSQGIRPSKSIMESPEEYDQRISKEQDELAVKSSSGEFDPEWADSPVQVLSAISRKSLEQSWDDWKGISLEQEAKKSVQRSLASRLLDEANTYLGTNQSSTFNRSELFRPFFGIHARGVSHRITEDKLRPTATSLSETDKSSAIKSIAAAARANNSPVKRGIRARLFGTHSKSPSNNLAKVNAGNAGSICWKSISTQLLIFARCCDWYNRMQRNC